MKWVYVLLLVLLIAVVSLGFYTQGYIASTSKQLDAKMLSIEKGVNQQRWEIAAKDFDDFLIRWDKVENKWGIFINHTEIDNIEMSLAKIKQFVSQKNIPDALAEIATVRSLLQHIPESEALHPLNIL